MEIGITEEQLENKYRQPNLLKCTILTSHLFSLHSVPGAPGKLAQAALCRKCYNSLTSM